MPSRSERLQALLSAAPSSLKRADGGLLPGIDHTGPRWNCEELAGRLTEVSGQGGSCALTAAAGLILDAQLSGEPAAWIRLPDSAFYPPDLADSGIDLAALVVVSVPDARRAARATERLIRSGAFGLVVVDLCPLGPRAQVSIPVQGRLVGLAQRHGAAVVFLTDKPADTPSLGSMISLRAELVREPLGPRAKAANATANATATPRKATKAARPARTLRAGDAGVNAQINGQTECTSLGQLRCRLVVRKDKRRGPDWSHSEVVRGPAGLR